MDSLDPRNLGSPEMDSMVWRKSVTCRVVGKVGKLGLEGLEHGDDINYNSCREQAKGPTGPTLPQKKQSLKVEVLCR